MADIFTSLRDRFISSMSSLIEKTPKTLVNIGISTGAASQTFNLPDRKITIDSDTLFVDSEIWTSVSTFASSTPTSKHYSITYSGSDLGMTTSRPVITFGNGVHGAIPTSGYQITMDYESCRVKLSDREILALFESSIIPVEISFGVSITVNDIDYTSYIFDISFGSDIPVEDMILHHAKMLFQIKDLDTDKAIYYKSQAVIIDGKSIAKSQLDHLVVVTNWYNSLVRRYIKARQIPRFILRSDIFEDEDA